MMPLLRKKLDELTIVRLPYPRQQKKGAPAVLKKILLLAAAPSANFHNTFFSLSNPGAAVLIRQRVLPLLEILAVVRFPGALDLLRRFEAADLAYDWLRGV